MDDAGKYNIVLGFGRDIGSAANELSVRVAEALKQPGMVLEGPPRLYVKKAGRAEPALFVFYQAVVKWVYSSSAPAGRD